ncbi:sodium:alanine symporter family protein [Clostridiaceae bacterium 35-E11]
MEMLNTLVNYLWGPPMMVLLIFTGLYFTVKTKFFQFTHFGYALNQTLLSIFKKDEKIHEAEGAITPFQAVSTALAGTVGNGNIAGVAAAIAIGGPGAIFWMWIVSFVGMATKMVEVSLAVHFRRKDENGNFYGGPMYYMEDGLGKKWRPLAKFYAASMFIAALGTAVYAQPHTMGVAMESAFGVPRLVTVSIAVLITGIVVIGGVKRVGQFCEKLVPTMCLLYIIGALGVVFANFHNIPAMFAMIVKYAFAPAPAAGGFAGATIMLAVRRGFSRGMFSNEAGMGSAPMVHATAITDHPVRQGLWGIAEVFVDTIVVANITALAILSSGTWNNGMSGAELTFSAFETVWGPWGPKIVTIGVLLFALSTMIGWSIEFETATTYLFGEKSMKYMKWFYFVPPFIAATMSVEAVWLVVDLSSGLLALPNLIGLLGLSGVFMKLFEDFTKKEKLNADKAA